MPLQIMIMANALRKPGRFAIGAGFGMPSAPSPFCKPRRPGVGFGNSAPMHCARVNWAVSVPISGMPLHMYGIVYARNRLH